MRKQWLILILLLPLVAAMMGPVCWTPEERESARRVLRALPDLESMDYVVVRNAIRELNGLVYAPNIKLAIRPLNKVLTNSRGYYDAYTRGMASHTLVMIGVTLGTARGSEAVEYVISELEGGRTQSVRASCAYSLGLTGWETVQAPLIAANEGDPSGLVREAACGALLLVTNGKYESASCHYIDEDEEEGTAMMMSSSKMDSQELETNDELRQLQNHIFMPLDSILSQGQPGPGEPE